MSATAGVPPPAIGDADLDYLRRLVYEESGIVIDSHKDYLLESRLLPLARSQGLSSLVDLAGALRAASGDLKRRVVEAMTTNETSFFRDHHPYESLREKILPEIIERKQTTRTLTIWSAACSTGQEPYTIAMILRTHFPELATDWKVRILATDLSEEILERAKTGRFSQFEVNRGLPTELRDRFFTPDGPAWQLSQEIRSQVEFRQMNLCSAWPFLGPIDVIFLRNVLIYFDEDTKKRILGRVRQTLAPGGYLFLGTAETTLNLDQGFERLPMGQAACYRDR